LNHLYHVFLGYILDSWHNGIILMVDLLSKYTNFRFNLLQRLFQSTSESLYSSRFYVHFKHKYKKSYNIWTILTQRWHHPFLWLL
jgi:hypothetical protein